MTSTFQGRVNGTPTAIQVTGRHVDLGTNGVIPMDGIDSVQLDTAQRCLTFVLTQDQTFHRTGAYGSQTYDITFAAGESENFVRLHSTIAAAIRGRR
jgi:hypothetical protein